MNFNSLLYRPIKSGEQYNALIPKASCKVTKLGSGMTDFSVQKMKEWIEKYAFQAAKIAPKFKKSSLENTVNAIHQFLYWHFQYKADQADQYIRSLACAWQERQTGIDCKTYSVIASKILTNLGIKHYIRRIKQPGFAPTEFTHVYVVVPFDQNKASLKRGYYVIDGTLKDNIEPVYTEKDDTLMLAHYGLNAPGLGNAETTTEPTRDSSGGSRVLDSISKSKIKISTRDIMNIFRKGWSPSCIGGTYDARHSQGVEGRVAPFFNALADRINAAVVSNGDVATPVNEWIRTTQLWLDHATRTVNKPGGWSSKCSRDHVAYTRKLAQTMNTLGINGILAWLAQYYNFNFITQSIPSNQYQFDSGLKKAEFFATIPVQLIANPTRKANIPNIVAFEFNASDIQKAESGQFDPAQFLGSLQNVVQTFQGSTITPGGTNPAGGFPNFQPLPTQNEQQAGLGLFGWLLLGSSLWYGYTKFIK